jgi:hypothetical protein
MRNPLIDEHEENRREDQRTWSSWLDEHCGPGCEEQLSGDFREELAELLSRHVKYPPSKLNGRWLEERS